VHTRVLAVRVSGWKLNYQGRSPMMAHSGIVLVAGLHAGRLAVGTAILLVGAVTLVFNPQWTNALVTGQREAWGALLGERRSWSDRIHASRLFLRAARIFTAVISAIFVAVRIAAIANS
jgi:hypothetical protein